MNYTAFLYKYLIGYCAEAMGLCMGAMAEEKDPAAAAELAKHCAAYAMMINVYAQRMASIAGEAAGASTDPETAEEEMKAQLSFIPEEATRGEVAKAALAAKRCGFRVGEVIAQVAALTGYEDPVQFKAGLLKLGEELQTLRTQTAAQAPVLTAVAAVAGAGSPEEQAGKLAAQAQTLAALQALQPVVAKAQVLTTKTDPAEVAAGLRGSIESSGGTTENRCREAGRTGTRARNRARVRGGQGAARGLRRDRQQPDFRHVGKGRQGK